MDTRSTYAPGQPGSPPKWTSSAKVGVGTALNLVSRVWFTLSHGVFDEVYHPHVDLACTRDMGFLVTDGRGYFSDEKRHTDHEVAYRVEGVPAYRLVNTCEDGRYRIVKDIITHPDRPVVLQRTRFVPLRGVLEDYHLYVLLAPHLGNHGYGNTAWVGDTKGVPMLFAEREHFALALACSKPWLKMSAGFVGVSDGWQDLAQHGQMTWQYTRAEDGNVALMGEVNLRATGGEFLLALAFSGHGLEAGHHALACLYDDFDALSDAYITDWQRWQSALIPLPKHDSDKHNLYRVSTMVLHTHEAKNLPGGIIASLSVPWGFNTGGEDLGGYHLVWVRDLAEAVSGLLAAGARQTAVRVLHYLQCTQEADGHWAQNMWLDGTPYWGGIQMDEAAFPILLTDTAWREKLIDDDDLARLWPMVHRAVGYVVRNGPVTQQDRWEENSGYSPFTLAVEIAALLCAADLAERADQPDLAVYLRETADAWNASIERWTYAEGTELAQRMGVDGYYVRLAPPAKTDQGTPWQGSIAIKNRPPDATWHPAVNIIGPDALALVRFGLRAADDPRIVNTVRVIDALLRVDTPYGPCWRRYNEDGYGEHDDGSPYDGTGRGRLWPLLTGERAHYELAAGRRDEAERLLRTLEAFANAGGMLPEQVWDSADIPEKELFFGRPSGSAMPLVWAHAEYIKLRRSVRDGRVFDMPPQTVQRYLVDKTPPAFFTWRFNDPIDHLPAGKTLRLEVLAQARVHWSADGWRTVQETETRPTSVGVHLADLPTATLPSGSELCITFYWPEVNHWEGKDYSVTVR